MRWASSADRPRSDGEIPPPPEPDAATGADPTIGAGGGHLAPGARSRPSGARRTNDDGDRRTRTAVALFLAVVLALLGVRACVVEPVRVASDSMRPTLHAGDWVLIDKVSDRWRPFVAGDVVMLSEPGSGRSIIKRIVALGGQAVELDDGRLVVDGAFVAEPYADLSRMAGRYLGPITVPPGHVFVLGDNRDDSRDSRVFGPVPTASVTGRMVARIGGSG